MRYTLKKFSLNKEGVKELLRSSEMQSICQEAAEGVAGNLPSGDYEVDSGAGSVRVHADVRPANAEAYYRNLQNNEMIKALGSYHRDWK